MHNCYYCHKKIECAGDKEVFLICDCEKMTITENKIKKNYYFCKSNIFPSCFESYLMRKYDVNYLKLMTLRGK